MTEKPFTLFVVDDDPFLRMVLIHQLQGNGYLIYEFDSGAECLAAMQMGPDLVLLDIEMPGQDGLEVCRQIRADTENDEVQVMFVTGHDDPETLMAGYAAGGDDLIHKNAKKDLLLRKVAIALENSQQKRPLSSAT